MKILKSLTLVKNEYTYQLVGLYHHVNDDDYEQRHGYSQSVVDERFSCDEVRNLGIMWASQRKVEFIDLVELKASVPLAEIYAHMDNGRA